MEAAAAEQARADAEAAAEQARADAEAERAEAERAEAERAVKTADVDAGADKASVVDGSTGKVVGTAYRNPETGLFEFVDPDTTVVAEVRSPSRGPGLGAVEVDGDGAESPQSPEPAGNTQKPNTFDPKRFDFKSKPSPENWQETSCVAIGFLWISSPIVKIEFGIIVGAPLELRDKTTISVARAQRETSAVGLVVAATIIEMLDAGEIVSIR